MRTSNAAGFGRTAEKLSAALDALEATTEHLLGALARGEQVEALSGATPYLRLFGLAASGAYLARAALAGGEEARVVLCRFFAENLIDETSALKDRVVDGPTA